MSKNVEAKLQELDKRLGEIKGILLEHDSLLEEGRLISDQIELLKKRRHLSLSDHAIVRYMERVLGIDIEQITNMVITESLKTKVNAMGNGTYGIGDGFKVIIKDNYVLTVVKKEKL